MLAICFIYRTIDFGKSFPLRSRSCAKKPAHQPPLHRHQRADILKFLVLWSQALPDSSMLARAGFTQSCYGTLSPSHRDKSFMGTLLAYPPLRPLGLSSCWVHQCPLSQSSPSSVSHVCARDCPAVAHTPLPCTPRPSPQCSGAYLCGPNTPSLSHPHWLLPTWWSLQAPATPLVLLA